MDRGYVLIVDDESEIRLSLEAVLQDEGYRVEKAESGSAALQLIQAEAPDVVLVDVWMPEMDGIKALKAVKGRNSAIEVVVMSGHGNIDAAVAATKLGAFHFIEKPLSIDTVLGVVDSAVKARRTKESQADASPNARHSDDAERTRGARTDISDSGTGVSATHLRQKIKAYDIEAPPVSTKVEGANQRSISKSVVLHGRGLHSGLKTGLLIEPLPPGSGIHFGSLTSPETVRASVDFVDDTNHATNLRNGLVEARTIEHLMSALHAYEVSNILIKVGEEVPVMDGSAVEFCRLLEEAGIEEQEEKRQELWVDKAYEVGGPGGDGGYIRIEPAISFSISCLVEYPQPIGRQAYLYEHKNVLGFQEKIARARTFGFVSELGALEEMGLAEGGRWDNAILVDEERIVNTELRFPDEFVRHKILDVMGDLYLAGWPIRGKVTAERSGHRHNVALVKKLVEAQG